MSEPNLETLWRNGSKAWGNVPDASKWVEDIRGNIDEKRSNMSGTPRMDACECRFSTLFHPEDSMWVPSVKAKELERELAEADECARKLSLKVEEQGRDIERLQATLQRKQDAGDLLFEELDDKTPEPNCSCHLFPPCSDCVNHGRSRYALDGWKEANK